MEVGTPPNHLTNLNKNTFGALRAITILLIFLLPATIANASQSLVTLRATRDIILADGKQQTIIIAEVRDASGNPLNGSVVQFQTSAGTLSESRVSTINGVARTRLTSSTIPGVAYVNAVAYGGAEGASDALQIEFTSDPSATVAGNDYVVVTGKYVAYSATDHTIVAAGAGGNASLTFRNFSVHADMLQLAALKGNVIKAEGNVVMKRGRYTLHALSVNYGMETGRGYAVATLNGKVQQVEISGTDLHLTHPRFYVPPAYLRLDSLQAKLVVVCKSITYFPGQKLQFRSPRFFQDKTQILALPYYEMGLTDHQLFSDHFISLGTAGLGLKVPFYYDLSPRTSGVVILRHQQQLGRGYFSTDPGWSLDILQGYSGGTASPYQGSYGFTGLTHGDWGFHWSHTQSFGDATQAAFYLDFPQHSGMFGDANLSTQTKQLSMGFDFSAGQSFTSIAGSSISSDMYAETLPHAFGPIKGLLYKIGTRINYGTTTSTDALSQAISQASGSLSLQVFARPRAIDKLTTFNESFSVGHVWTGGQYSGNSALATLSLDHTFQHGGSVTLAYDYISTPVSMLDSGGHNRVSLIYHFLSGKRFSASMFGTSYLDATNASAQADLAYRINNDWRILASATLHSDSMLSYKDFELTLGRRIGARELQLTYSTFLKRISLDLTSTNW